VWIAAPVAIAVASGLGLALYDFVRASSAVRGAAPIEVIKITLTLMIALGAVLTGVYAYRKQRLSEGDASRADADQLTQRYSTAAEQLGHDKAAIRLAGVFAMARLADDWPKQRQECIDVLCAYLRMPAEPAAGLSESEVRATIVRSIAAHLRDHSVTSWVEHDFDFTGACLHDADFDGVTFSGDNTTFTRVTFVGERTTFVGVDFCGKNTSFSQATFSGRTTRFKEAKFSGDGTWFDRSTFSGDYTDFGGATFAATITWFDGATFSAKTTWFGATFSGAFTKFEGAIFSGSIIAFNGAQFSGESIGFRGATFSAKDTWFNGAQFSGETIDFEGATFSGQMSNFTGVTFSGGTSADHATAKSSFVGSNVLWGPISPRSLPSAAAGVQ